MRENTEMCHFSFFEISSVIINSSITTPNKPNSLNRLNPEKATTGRLRNRLCNIGL